MSLLQRQARPLKRDGASLRDDRLFIVACKEEHYPIAAVPDACKRAKRRDSDVSGGDNPDGNTSRVYLLWEAIVSKALPSQLPQPLAEWRP